MALPLLMFSVNLASKMVASKVEASRLWLAVPATIVLAFAVILLEATAHLLEPSQAMHRFVGSRQSAALAGLLLALGVSPVVGAGASTDEASFAFICVGGTALAAGLVGLLLTRRRLAYCVVAAMSAVLLAVAVGMEVHGVRVRGH